MSTSHPTTRNNSNDNNNPLDNILTLEDQYYREGYDLGLTDGSHAGKLEGRATGLETGFEKFKQMGMLAGKTAVWAGRLARMDSATTTTIITTSSRTTPVTTVVAVPSKSTPAVPASAVPEAAIHDDSKAPHAHSNHENQRSSLHRLRNHIATLHALSDAQTLSTVNDEDACTAFDDRLKRATAKARVVESIMGDGKVLKEEEEEKSPEKTGNDGTKHTERKKNLALREW